MKRYESDTVGAGLMAFSINGSDIAARVFRSLNSIDADRPPALDRNRRSRRHRFAPVRARGRAHPIRSTLWTAICGSGCQGGDHVGERARASAQSIVSVGFQVWISGMPVAPPCAEIPGMFSIAHG